MRQDGAATDDGAPPQREPLRTGLRGSTTTHVLAGRGQAIHATLQKRKKNIKVVRKQARVSRWAIRLGRLLEGIIVDTDDHDAEGTPMDVDTGRR